MVTQTYMPIGVGTNLDVKTGSVNVSLTNSDGNATRVSCTTANIPSAVAGYAVGCTLTDTTTGIPYVNTGTTSSCTFTKSAITATGTVGYYVIEKTLTGTTAVNVFGTTNPFSGTITGAYAITSGTISTTVTLSNASSTVGTITTGATVGLMAGMTSVSNATFSSGGTMNVVSSNNSDTAKVFITFTV